jgi:hypothetical protein
MEIAMNIRSTHESELRPKAINPKKYLPSASSSGKGVGV